MMMMNLKRFTLPWGWLAVILTAAPMLLAAAAPSAFAGLAAAAPAMSNASNFPAVATPAQPAASAAPVISKVEPASAGPGSNLILTIKGRNFVQGATIAFSNPKITVLATTFKSKSELTAHIRIASDASTGSTGLFVVNPDQSEVEGSFSVSGAAINTAPKTAASAGAAGAKAPAGSASGKTLTFDVFNVGDVVQVFKTKSEVHGTLTLGKGVLNYTESGAKVFSVPVSEVQEVAPNIFFGLNTGTFHIFLTNGKHYNFTAASLNPADTEKIATQLQQALK